MKAAAKRGTKWPAISQMKQLSHLAISRGRKKVFSIAFLVPRVYAAARINKKLRAKKRGDSRVNPSRKELSRVNVGTCVPRGYNVAFMGTQIFICDDGAKKS